MKTVLMIDALDYPIVTATKPLEKKFEHLADEPEYHFHYMDYSPEDQGGENGVHCKFPEGNGGRGYPKNNTQLMEDLLDGM